MARRVQVLCKRRATCRLPRQLLLRFNTDFSFSSSTNLKHIIQYILTNSTGVKYDSNIKTDGLYDPLTEKELDNFFVESHFLFFGYHLMRRHKPYTIANKNKQNQTNI